MATDRDPEEFTPDLRSDSGAGTSRLGRAPGRHRDEPSGEEQSTQAEIERHATEEPDDPQTHREEVELDIMETTTDGG